MIKGEQHQQKSGGKEKEVEVRRLLPLNDNKLLIFESLKLHNILLNRFQIDNFIEKKLQNESGGRWRRKWRWRRRRGEAERRQKCIGIARDLTPHFTF